MTPLAAITYAPSARALFALAVISWPPDVWLPVAGEQHPRHEYLPHQGWKFSLNGLVTSLNW